MRRFVEEHPVLVGLGASAAVGLVLVVRRRSTRTGTEVDLSKEHLSESGKTYMDNLVTDLYEWGWGQSFHFGPRFRGESLEASITRAEFHLANRLHMKQGMKVLDVGCGVGGPMRNIAMFTGSTVTGITLDEYQAALGNKQNEAVGQDRICKVMAGDFQKQPFRDGTFDAAYAIEATCHAPDRLRTYGEVARVLKPGAYFAGYEWVMTDKYDLKDAAHVQCKEGIEEGGGLPTLAHYSEVVQDIKDAGFEVVEFYDANRGVHSANEVPWYAALDGHLSTLSGLRTTAAGRAVSHCAVWAAEMLTLVAPGSTRAFLMLHQTAADLCNAGGMEIFTPSFYFLARKK